MMPKIGTAANPGFFLGMKEKRKNYLNSRH